MSAAGYSRQPSLNSGDEKQHVDTNGGDYSTRMSELFDDDDDDTPTVSAPHFDFDDDDDDEEEAFVYDGADAQVTRFSYREQLREVLDDDDDDDDTAEEHEVERSLLHDRDHPPIALEDEALVSHSVQHACSMLISRGAHNSTLFSLASGQLHTFSAFLCISISFLTTNYVLLLTQRSAHLFIAETVPPSNNLASALVHTQRFARILRDECALCFSRRFTCPL